MAEPTPNQPSLAHASQVQAPPVIPGPQSVCTDLVKATCEMKGGVAFDGTGSTQEASRFTDRVRADAIDYFDSEIASSSPYTTEINGLLASSSNYADIKTITALKCELKDESCRIEARTKLSEIFKDTFLTDLKITTGASIGWGCSRPSCKYNSEQSEAYLNLIRAQKLNGIGSLLEESQGKFFETQNVEMRQRVRDIFPKIREEMKRVIAGMGLSPEVTRAIYSKIDATQVSTECVGSGYDPRSFAWSDMDESGNRKVIVCDGMLTGNSSDFSLVFSLAHEIAHQLDPCLIHFGPEKFRYTPVPGATTHAELESQNPFYDGVRCLRSPQTSVGAVLTDNYHEGSFFHNLNYESGPGEFSTPFCRADRINEAFCDAMGAKVMAAYFQNPANTGGKTFSASEWRAGLLNTGTLLVQPTARCTDDRLYWQSKTDEYPNMNLRMNGLLMANRKIRELAGCDSIPSSYQQCL